MKNKSSNYKLLTDSQKEAIGMKRKKRRSRDEIRRDRMKKSRIEQQFYLKHGYLPN